MVDLYACSLFDPVVVVFDKVCNTLPNGGFVVRLSSVHKRSPSAYMSLPLQLTKL